MTKPIRFSTFENIKDNTPQDHTTPSWSDFIAWLADVCICRAASDPVKKTGTLMVSPALYPWDATRANNNVRGWGAWCALDIDNDGLIYVSADEAAAVLTEMGLNFLVYGSTKHNAHKHRFRIVLELSRELGVMEIQSVHAAVVQKFACLGPDPSCKDEARIYAAPMFWQSGPLNDEPLHTFEFNIDGVALDVDAVLAAYLPPPPPAVPEHVRVFIDKRKAMSPQLRAASDALRATKTRSLPTYSSLLDCPVVSSEAIDAYMGLPKGGHHAGLFNFMMSVAARAKLKGYELTASELVDIAREIDRLSPVQTNPERWRTIHREADKALAEAGRL